MLSAVIRAQTVSTNTVFTLSFSGPGNGYLSTSDIKVYSRTETDGIKSAWSEITSFTVDGTTVTTTVAPAVGEVMIRRVTAKDDVYFNYASGSSFTKLVQYNSFLYSLYLAQEGIDNFADGFPTDDTTIFNNLDMQDNRIVNLGDAIGDTDAVNKQQLQVVQDEVDAAEVRLDSAESRLTTNESTLVAHGTNITTNANNISTLQGYRTNDRSDIDSNDTDIAWLMARVDQNVKSGQAPTFSNVFVTSPTTDPTSVATVEFVLATLTGDGGMFASEAAAAAGVETTSIMSPYLTKINVDANTVKADLDSPVFVGDPTAPTPATSDNSKSIATTEYVNEKVDGLNWKESVLYATTAAGDLATDFAAGGTVDGGTLVEYDRILIKDQADATENGPYDVQASGAPVRSTDADTSVELTQATMFVQGGTLNADTQWTQTAKDPVIGTDDIVFAQIKGAGAAVKIPVNDASHGFVVGEAVRKPATGWAKSYADDGDTSEVEGVVANVLDVDNFEIAPLGSVGLTVAQWTAVLGVAPVDGDVWWLNLSTEAKQYTKDPLSILEADNALKVCLKFISTTEAVIKEYPAVLLGDDYSGHTFISSAAAVAGSGTVTVNHNLNTLAPVIGIYEASGGDQVIPIISNRTLNSFDADFGTDYADLTYPLEVRSVGAGANVTYNISSDLPEDIGTAAAGNSGEAAAIDHVHGVGMSTFTPTVYDAITGGNEANAYGEQSGYYADMGDVVLYKFYLLNVDTTGMTAGNNLFIRGFPSTASDNNVADIVTNKITTTALHLSINLSGDAATIRETISGANNDAVIVSELTSGSNLIAVTGMYFKA